MLTAQRRIANGGAVFSVAPAAVAPLATVVRRRRSPPLLARAVSSYSLLTFRITGPPRVDKASLRYETLIPTFSETDDDSTLYFDSGSIPRSHTRPRPGAGRAGARQPHDAIRRLMGRPLRVRSRASRSHAGDGRA